MNSQAPASDPRVGQILGIFSQLASGNWEERVPPSGQDDELDRIMGGLNGLAEALAQRYAILVESEKRFEECLDVISAMAALDFSKKASVSDNGTLLDAFASGINMLSEELVVSTVSRAYVDNILESMNDALVVIDPQHVIRTVNHAALRLFGYPKEAIIGQSLDLLFAPEVLAGEKFTAITSKKGHSIEETECRTKDGQVFPVSLSTSAMHGANGQIEGVVCIVRDISERKQAEEALRRSIMQEETIHAQAAALAELSTPLIPINDQVVVMPLVGKVDTRRAQDVMETLLHGVAASGAQVAILDITGVPVVDTQIANVLVQAAQAVKLLGAQAVLTGIRPEVAQTLVDLDVDLKGIVTHSTLQSGIAAMVGRRYESRRWER